MGNADLSSPLKIVQLFVSGGSRTDVRSPQMLAPAATPPEKQNTFAGRAAPEKASEFSGTPTVVREGGEELCLPRVRHYYLVRVEG